MVTGTQFKLEGQGDIYLSLKEVTELNFSTM